MKDIYLNSTFKNKWNIEFNVKIGEALVEKGITCHLPRKKTNNQERSDIEIFNQDMEGIKNSLVVLSIALNESPNWGAEIGYAYGIGKPILALTDKNHEIPLICKGMIKEVVTVSDLDSIGEYIDLLVEKIKKLV